MSWLELKYRLWDILRDETEQLPFLEDLVKKIDEGEFGDPTVPDIVEESELRKLDSETLATAAMMSYARAMLATLKVETGQIMRHSARALELTDLCGIDRVRWSIGLPATLQLAGTLLGSRLDASAAQFLKAALRSWSARVDTQQRGLLPYYFHVLSLVFLLDVFDEDAEQEQLESQLRSVLQGLAKSKPWVPSLDPIMLTSVVIFHLSGRMLSDDLHDMVNKLAPLFPIRLRGLVQAILNEGGQDARGETILLRLAECRLAGGMPIPTTVMACICLLAVRLLVETGGAEHAKGALEEYRRTISKLHAGASEADFLSATVDGYAAPVSDTVFLEETVKSLNSTAEQLTNDERFGVADMGFFHEVRAHFRAYVDNAYAHSAGHDDDLRSKPDGSSSGDAVNPTPFRRLPVDALAQVTPLTQSRLA